MKVKTGEIIKELKEKGVKYNQYKGEQYTISWRQAYQIAEINDRIAELENENDELRERLEKRRKFWFFK